MLDTRLGRKIAGWITNGPRWNSSLCAKGINHVHLSPNRSLALEQHSEGGIEREAGDVEPAQRDDGMGGEERETDRAAEAFRLGMGARAEGEPWARLENYKRRLKDKSLLGYWRAQQKKDVYFRNASIRADGAPNRVENRCDGTVAAMNVNIWVDTIRPWTPSMDMNTRRYDMITLWIRYDMPRAYSNIFEYVHPCYTRYSLARQLRLPTSNGSGYCIAGEIQIMGTGDC
ncbi:hypothetical protein C8R45DRAFT_1076636, partial [Mycena sanguinolenta]